MIEFKCQRKCERQYVNLLNKIESNVIRFFVFSLNQKFESSVINFIIIIFLFFIWSFSISFFRQDSNLLSKFIKIAINFAIFWIEINKKIDIFHKNFNAICIKLDTTRTNQNAVYCECDTMKNDINIFTTKINDDDENKQQIKKNVNDIYIFLKKNRSNHDKTINRIYVFENKQTDSKNNIKKFRNLLIIFNKQKFAIKKIDIVHFLFFDAVSFFIIIAIRSNFIILIFFIIFIIFVIFVVFIVFMNFIVFIVSSFFREKKTSVVVFANIIKKFSKSNDEKKKKSTMTFESDIASEYVDAAINQLNENIDSFYKNLMKNETNELK